MGGFISSYSVGGRGEERLVISHLLYVDDNTLPFC